MTLASIAVGATWMLMLPTIESADWRQKCWSLYDRTFSTDRTLEGRMRHFKEDIKAWSFTSD